MRLALSCLIVALASSAPFQCTTEPDPEAAMEETPGQALYELAERFKREGNEQAWRTTLEQLIERYPSSRFAKTAKEDLGRE